MATQTPGQVRRALTTRLKALTPETGYAQYPAGQAAWRAVWRIDTDTLDNAPSVRAHLSFFFDDSEIESAGHSRINVAEGYEVSSDIVLRFLYQMRPNKESEDWDAAADAANHVLRDLVDFGLTQADINVSPTDGLSILREQVDDDPWLLVQVHITAGYCLNLTL